MDTPPTTTRPRRRRSLPARAGRPRPRRAFLWVAAFVVGVVVAAVGLGLGPPHLREEGLGLVGALGTALLAAGLVLAGWSAWQLLGRLRRRWWSVAVPPLLLTAYLALWTVGLGVAASLPAHPPLGERTPADLGLAYEDVRLPAGDGVELAGWWVPSRNGAAVVALHGAGSTRTAVLDQAAVLAEHGFGVLLLDARGHGESEGRGMELGWYGESDVAAALDFLASRSEVEAGQVGLLGLSMGGEEAIGAAGVDARVAAVVAEGATNRVADDKGYLDDYGWRGRWQQRVDQVTYAVAGWLTAAPEPAPLRDSAVAAAERGVRLLLVTASEVPDERRAADRIAAGAPDSVEVWTVSGAGHTGGLEADPDGWADRVVSFLEGELLGPSER